MPLHVVVRPRFGDATRITTDELGRPRFVAEVGAGSVLAIEVDDEPGSTELAAQFARGLAEDALRFAQRCEESLSKPA